MNKIFRFFCLGIIFIFLFSSCSIEKRKYLPGYNIEWKNSKPEYKKSEPEHLKKTHDAENAMTADQPSQDNFSRRNNFTTSANNNVIRINHSNKKIKIPEESLPDTCDVIYLKNGDEINAKVIEISNEEIKYKRCDDVNGEIYTLKKSSVFMVKYPNGTKDLISPENSTNVQNKSTETEDNGMFGIMSFISPLIGLFLVIILDVSGAGEGVVVIFLIFSIAAIILGAIGSGKERKLKGLAIAGLIIGAFFTLIVLLNAISGY